MVRTVAYSASVPQLTWRQIYPLRESTVSAEQADFETQASREANDVAHVIGEAGRRALSSVGLARLDSLRRKWLGVEGLLSAFRF